MKDEEELKDWITLKPKFENAMDMRGTITHECVCGSNLWRVGVVFEDYEISMYLLDMECMVCGSYATAPTPLDRPLTTQE